MNLKTEVLVRNITNLHDARYCAGMGVKAVGFPMHKCSQEDLAKFREIMGWLSGIEYIAQLDGEKSFLESDLEGFGWVEMTDITFLEQIKSLNKKALLKLTMEELKALSSINLSSFTTDLALLVTLEIDNIKNSLKELKENYGFLPVYIDSGITKENVPEILSVFPGVGFSLTPGVEIKTGINDFEALSEVLEALDIDEYA